MFSKSEKQIKKIDNAMEEIEASIHEKLYELGHMFYEINKDKDIDVQYKGKIDSIKQFEAQKKELFKEKLAIQGLMQCESCGSVISNESVFCNNCGNKVKDDGPVINKKRCKFCGTLIEENMKFCVSCGKLVEESREEA